MCHFNMRYALDLGWLDQQLFSNCWASFKNFLGQTRMNIWRGENATAMILDLDRLPCLLSLLFRCSSIFFTIVFLHYIVSDVQESRWPTSRRKDFVPTCCDHFSMIPSRIQRSLTAVQRFERRLGLRLHRVKSKLHYFDWFCISCTTLEFGPK